MEGVISKNNDLNIGKGLFLRAILLINLLFLWSPLFIIVVFSFNSSRTIAQWEHFSVKWYGEIFCDSFLWVAIRNSLIIAILNTVVATLLATMLALAVGKYRFRGKKLVLNMIYVPIILPEIIFGISILSLYTVIHFPLGIVSILCAHITFSISFVALIILSRIEHLDKNIEEASLDLGASRWYTFRRVLLPVLFPGILSGALFAFTLSIDDFIVTFFTSGTGSSTLPLKIYSMVKFSPTPAINALSTLMILFTMFAICVLFLLQKSEVTKKRLGLGAVAAVCVILIILSLSTVLTKGKRALNILNYAGYMNEVFVRNFEKEFNVRVQIDYFNDNEELLSKLQMGAAGYDIIVPSGYMVEIMIKERLLAEINFDNIPNITHIDLRFRSLDFDPGGKYSVPYAYGFTGIAYNSNAVKETVDSLRILWDPKYKGKILMTDDMREVFNYGYGILGYSLADQNPRHLKEAFDVLLKQKPLLKKYDSNMAMTYLLSGEVSLAQTWSGAAYRFAQDHPEIKFAVPKEIKPLFVDNLCIPENTDDQALAEAFINYLLEPKNTALNIQHILYAMPNPEALKYLDRSLVENPILFPDINNFDQVQIINDLGEFNSLLEKAWIELKSR